MSQFLRLQPDHLVVVAQFISVNHNKIRQHAHFTRRHGGQKSLRKMNYGQEVTCRPFWSFIFESGTAHLQNRNAPIAWKVIWLILCEKLCCNSQQKLPSAKRP